jgi:hypothetical protein
MASWWPTEKGRTLPEISQTRAGRVSWLARTRRPRPGATIGGYSRLGAASQARLKTPAPENHAPINGVGYFARVRSASVGRIENDAVQPPCRRLPEPLIRMHF